MTGALDKWGEEIIEANGFVVLPTVLLYSVSRLGINSTEALVLLILISHWWDNAEAEVFPSSAGIANRIGVSARTVDRAISQLVEKGLIEHRGKKDNRYGATVRHLSLEPLRERLEKIVEKRRKREGNYTQPLAYQ